MTPPAFLNPLLVDDLVRRALEEDLGRAGDITSDACLPPGAVAEAVFAAREDGVVAGLPFAAAAFRLLDPSVAFRALVADGARVARGARVAGVRGPARAILAGERVALNVLGRLSGVATLTAAFVAAVEGTGARIACTRKTTPGLRAAEKWAVRMGGGSNHRYGLDDAVLVKDNHVAVCGGVVPALRRAKAAVGHLVRIEIEVDTLDQLAEVLAEGADVVLLDNMDPATLARAVAMVAGRMVTEASGGVSLETVRAVAVAGVDLVSVGALTHSARVLDLGLDVVVTDHAAEAGPARAAEPSGAAEGG